MPSTIITPTNKEKLYSQVFHLLGMPIRSIELTEEQMAQLQKLREETNKAGDLPDH